MGCAGLLFAGGVLCALVAIAASPVHGGAPSPPSDDYFSDIDLFEDICGVFPGRDACCTAFSGDDCLGAFDKHRPAISTVATWAHPDLALHGIVSPRRA